MESTAEWAGSSSRWHIQHHNRDLVGPSGHSHWPKRPHDIGGFLNSIADHQILGKKHAYDPPSSMIPLEQRTQQWRSSSRKIEPFRPLFDRATGTKHIVPEVPEEGLGWTGKFNNFTGPRHFAAAATSINPKQGQSTQSYYLEKTMGTKKAVFSSAMGLPEYYGEGERRCLRPATEWSLDAKMQRKIRVPDLIDRRNGIGDANPGDKGYATSEHAPEYMEMMLEENRGRGNMARKVMSKIDKTWSMSGADPMLDKQGRRMNDYIQLYCKTPYRKNSMYVHRNAAVKEIADMASEGGSKKVHIFYKGKRLVPHSCLLELGIGAKCTVELLMEEELPEKKTTYKEKETMRAHMDEMDFVKNLDTLKLEDKFPATDREEYQEAEAAEE